MKCPKKTGHKSVGLKTIDYLLTVNLGIFYISTVVRIASLLPKDTNTSKYLVQTS